MKRAAANLPLFSTNVSICSSEPTDNEPARYQNTLEALRERELTRIQKAWTYGASSVKIPSRSWPSVQPDEEEVPGLRSRLAECKRLANPPPAELLSKPETPYSTRPKMLTSSSVCDEIQFDLATALRGMPWQHSALKEGQALYKDLALRGHASGMVGLGVCLAGGEPGNTDEPTPQAEAEACEWWRVAGGVGDSQQTNGLGGSRRGPGQERGHPEALYQLGVATYTGAGLKEDEMEAARLFAKSIMASCPSSCLPENAFDEDELVVSKGVAAGTSALEDSSSGGSSGSAEEGGEGEQEGVEGGEAHCHPAALYMLGDCLLEGIGVQARDRSSALGLLLHAGELGHRGARSRLLTLLLAEPPASPSSSSSAGTEEGEKGFGLFTDASRQSLRRDGGTERKAVTASGDAGSDETCGGEKESSSSSSSGGARFVASSVNDNVSADLPPRRCLTHQQRSCAASSSSAHTASAAGCVSTAAAATAAGNARAIALDIRRRRTQAVLRPEDEALEAEREWFGAGGWEAVIERTAGLER